MKHLLTILEIKHINSSGKVIWSKKNIKNIIHSGGEYYSLAALFNTSEVSIPTNYYAGLDRRTSPVRSDTFSNLSQEPTQYGYARQPLASADGFTVDVNDDDIYQATSGVITFSATGGTWGPVSNIFLATTQDNSGYLLSTASLGGEHVVDDGDQLLLRCGVTLTEKD